MSNEQVMVNQYYVMWVGQKNPKRLTFHWRGQPDPLKTITLPKDKWMRVTEQDAAEIRRRAGDDSPNWKFMIKQVMPAEDRIDYLEGKHDESAKTPNPIKDSPKQSDTQTETMPLGEGDVFKDSQASPESNKRGRPKKKAEISA